MREKRCPWVCRCWAGEETAEEGTACGSTPQAKPSTQAESLVPARSSSLTPFHPPVDVNVVARTRR